VEGNQRRGGVWYEVFGRMEDEGCRKGGIEIGRRSRGQEGKVKWGGKKGRWVSFVYGELVAQAGEGRGIRGGRWNQIMGRCGKYG
jgi:hypothetical protein